MPYSNPNIGFFTGWDHEPPEEKATRLHYNRLEAERDLRKASAQSKAKEAGLSTRASHEYIPDDKIRLFGSEEPVIQKYNRKSMNLESELTAYTNMQTNAMNKLTEAEKRKNEPNYASNYDHIYPMRNSLEVAFETSCGNFFENYLCLGGDKFHITEIVTGSLLTLVGGIFSVKSIIEGNWSNLWWWGPTTAAGIGLTLSGLDDGNYI